MNLKDKIEFRHVWWGIMLIGSSIYFFKFFDRISSEPTAIDGTITLSLIILLFMPLVKEISAFGMSIKKEVREVKSDMRKEVASIKNEIFTLAISNSQKQEVHFYNKPPTEEEVNRTLAQKDKELLKDATSEDTNDNDNGAKKTEHESGESKEVPLVAESSKGYNTSDLISKHKVSETQIFLFNAKLALENELLEIESNNQLILFNNLLEKASILRHGGFITREAEKMINDIGSICNRGIHGEIIDSKYIEYIKYQLDKLKVELQKNPEDSMDKFTTCHKCGYSGKAYYSNECPRCRTVSCD